MKTLIFDEWKKRKLFLLVILALTVLNITAYSFLKDKVPLWIVSSINSTLFPLIIAIVFFIKKPDSESGDTTFPEIDSAQIFWARYLSGAIFVLLLALVNASVLPDLLSQLLSQDVMLNSFHRFGIILGITAPITNYSMGVFCASLSWRSLKPVLYLLGIFVLLSFLTTFVVFNLYVLFGKQLDILLLPGEFLLNAIFIYIPFRLWQRKHGKELRAAKTVLARSFCAVLILNAVSFGAARLYASVHLKNALGTARQSGLKVTVKEIIPPQISPNGAQLLLQAASIDEALREKYKKSRPNDWKTIPYEGGIYIEKLTDAQKKVAARIVLHEPEALQAYELMKKAAAMPCRFNINYQEGPNMPLSHLSKIRDLARMTAARAYLLAFEGRYAEAMESAQTGLRLGNVLENEPTLMSQLVRIAVDMIALRSLVDVNNASKNGFSEKDCQNLADAVNAKQRSTFIGLEGELATLNETAFTVEVFLAKDIQNQVGENPSSPVFLVVLRAIPPLFKPFVDEERAFYISSMTRIIPFCRRPYFTAKDKLSGIQKEILNEYKMTGKHTIAAFLLVPVEIRAAEAQAGYNAKIDAFRIALGLKIFRTRHGTYPDTLSLLTPDILPQLPVDPFTGKDFIYHQRGKGFIVYSVGPNVQDDQGVTGLKEHPEADDVGWRFTN